MVHKQDGNENAENDTPTMNVTEKALSSYQNKSRLAQTAESSAEMVSAYINRRGKKMLQKNFCYRHRPENANHLPDEHTMDELKKDLESLPEEDSLAISHMWSLFRAANSAQRRIIMKGMLSQCCSPQLSDVASTTKELLRIDFVSSLPIELAFKVLGYLDATSLCNAAMVCKRWKRLADDDVVWYHLCEQHIDKKCTTCGWGLPLLERRRLKRSKQAVIDRLESLSNSDSNAPFNQVQQGSTTSGTINNALTTVNPSTSGIDSLNAPVAGTTRKSGLEVAAKRPCCPPALAEDSEERSTRPWKEIYLERYKIENNWRLGKCVVKDFQHNSPILCLQFDEQYMITGTCDGYVNIWDVESRKLIHQLYGHIRGVSALKFDSCKLVTGSWDQSVRVWNYRTGECLCTFGGHESKILCIDFDSNLIAAGSADATVKIWDFVTKSCFTLRGHKGPVHSVRIHKASNTLFTSSEDCTVLMWSLDEKKIIRAFGGPENGPLAHVGHIQYALPMTLEHLEGENDLDHHILAHANVDGLTTLGELSEMHRDASATSVDEEHRATWPTHLLTASLDNTIKLWDICTGKCVRTLFGHIDGVWCIAANHFRIVSGAQDKMVKVWDVQSGKCWHTYSGHVKAVSCVGITDVGFASGGDDGLVKLYSFDN